MTQASGSKLARPFQRDSEQLNPHFATTDGSTVLSLSNFYMEPLTFAILFAVCITSAFVGGYVLGNLKATCQAEQTRRWWMNRQIRRERGE